MVELVFANLSKGKAFLIDKRVILHILHQINFEASPATKLLSKKVQKVIG